MQEISTGPVIWNKGAVVIVEKSTIEHILHCELKQD